MLANVAAAILVIIAALHSILGEKVLLGPLFARSWELGIPRYAAERILRFAWHLTSIAWVGLAVALAGLPIVHAFGLVCTISGVIIFATLRGHLAWPLFSIAGAGAWASQGAIPNVMLVSAATAGAVLAASIAGLHVYWGAGGRWGAAAVLPQRDDGSPGFEPGPLACLAVAAACAGLAGALVWPSLASAPSFIRIVLWVAMVAFVLRAIGDGRQIGFSKTNRDTAFAKADDALYSPLVVGLAFACGAGLLLA